MKEAGGRGGRISHPLLSWRVHGPSCLPALDCELARGSDTPNRSWTQPHGLPNF